MVDADHGYGNALGVMRTVEELETAGVAALTIEDTALPQPFNATGGILLTSIDEGVGKMRAALSVRLPILLGGVPPELGDNAYLAGRGGAR